MANLDFYRDGFSSFRISSTYKFDFIGLLSLLFQDDYMFGKCYENDVKTIYSQYFQLF